MIPRLAYGPLARRLLVGLVFLLAVDNASAAEWVYVTTSANTGNVFIDIESVVRGKDGVSKVWVKTEYLEPQTLSGLGKYSSTVNLEQFRCSERTMRQKSSTYYSDKGEVVESGSEDVTYTDVVPETIGESLFEVACGKKPLKKQKVEPMEGMEPVAVNLSSCELRSEKATDKEVAILQLTCSPSLPTSPFLDEWQGVAPFDCQSQHVSLGLWFGIRYEQVVGFLEFPLPTSIEDVEEALLKKYCPGPPPTVEGVPASSS